MEGSVLSMIQEEEEEDPSTADISVEISVVEIQDLNSDTAQFGKVGINTSTPIKGEKTTERSSQGNRTKTERRYQDCPYVTKYSQNLVRHRRIHTKEYIECPTCQRNFIDKYQLGLHVGHAHTGKVEICDQCGKKFTSVSGLYKHIQLFHDNRANYACELCGQTFLNKKAWHGHMNKHSKCKPFICNLCKKAFQYAFSLERHHAESCMNQQAFKCDSCGKDYATKERLKAHISGAHSAPTYKCETCEKAFQWRGTLYRHKKKFDH